MKATRTILADSTSWPIAKRLRSLFRRTLGYAWHTRLSCRTNSVGAGRLCGFSCIGKQEQRRAWCLRTDGRQA